MRQPGNCSCVRNRICFKVSNKKLSGKLSLTPTAPETEAEAESKTADRAVIHRMFVNDNDGYDDVVCEDDNTNI